MTTWTWNTGSHEVKGRLFGTVTVGSCCSNVSCGTDPSPSSK